MPLGTRKIGQDKVSEIGFGAMGLSAFYGNTLSEHEKFKVGANFKLELFVSHSTSFG